MARLTNPLLVALWAVVAASPPAHAGGSPDLNGDGYVDTLDLDLLLSEWEPVACSTTAVGLLGNIDVSGAVGPGGSLHEVRAFFTAPSLTAPPDVAATTRRSRRCPRGSRPRASAFSGMRGQPCR